MHERGLNTKLYVLKYIITKIAEEVSNNLPQICKNKTKRKIN